MDWGRPLGLSSTFFPPLHDHDVATIHLIALLLFLDTSSLGLHWTDLALLFWTFPGPVVLSRGWAYSASLGLPSLHLSWECIGLFPRAAMDSFPGCVSLHLPSSLTLATASPLNFGLRAVVGLGLFVILHSSYTSASLHGNRHPCHRVFMALDSVPLSGLDCSSFCTRPIPVPLFIEIYHGPQIGLWTLTGTPKTLTPHGVLFALWTRFLSLLVNT